MLDGTVTIPIKLETDLQLWAISNLSHARRCRLRIKTKMRRGVPTHALRNADAWVLAFKKISEAFE